MNLEFNIRLEDRYTSREEQLNKVYPNPTPGLIYFLPAGGDYYDYTESCLYVFVNEKWRQIDVVQ